MINPPVDDDADQLTDRYRRASAADPSRPGDAVRAAIVTEAKVQAVARAAGSGKTPIDIAAPVANDSRWPVRAAAGVAVVAVGVLIALQISHHPEPEILTAPVAVKPAAVIPATPPAAAQITVAQSDAAYSPVPPLAALPARARERAEVQLERAEVQAVASSEQRVGVELVDPAAEMIAPSMAARLLSSDSLLDMRRPAPAGAVARVRDPAQDRAIVAQYFPEAFRGPLDQQPIWVLLDRHGHVLQTGRHFSVDKAVLRAYLESRIPGARIDEWQATTLSEGGGRTVTVTFAWVAGDPATPGGP